MFSASLFFFRLFFGAWKCPSPSFSFPFSTSEFVFLAVVRSSLNHTYICVCKRGCCGSQFQLHILLLLCSERDTHTHTHTDTPARHFADSREINELRNVFSPRTIISLVLRFCSAGEKALYSALLLIRTLNPEKTNHTYQHV
jgi:hypothetical protein